MKSTPYRRGFASDNNSGIHPDVLEAICHANSGHTLAYGDDPYTESAVNKFKAHFGKDIEVYFVYNGTGANVLGINAATEPYHAVICADTAHIHVDECGAPERFTGCKLLAVSTPDGKLSVDGIKPHMHGFGVEHHAQPKVVSITQATELGTVYRPEEIAKLSKFVHENGMLLHMDGARLANAAVFLDSELCAITKDVGVDVLSFGGTKNGIMVGEAIVFFNRKLARNFKYLRKQGMQLASKMRFISVQFDAFLSNDLWRKNAAHSNRMAKLLSREVEKLPDLRIQITRPVEANGIFVKVPQDKISVMQSERFFYVWNEETSEVRWMTSFDTTEEDILSFVDFLKKILLDRS